MEDNPLRAKQRKERDISSLSAEMRQMEEQYVTVFSRFYRPTVFLAPTFADVDRSIIRFTPYDFKKMHRRSYYPQTQIVSTVTATSSTGPSSSRPVTPMTIGNDGPHEGYNYNHKSEHDIPMIERTSGVEMAELSEKAL